MKTMRHIFAPLMLITILLWGGSCTKETNDTTGGGEEFDNFAISISPGAVSRGGGPEAVQPLPSTVASGLQLYAFSNGSQPVYWSRIDVREVEDATVKGKAPIGTWNVVMNYFPQSQRAQRIAPQLGAELDTAPLFDYTTPGTPGDGATEISNSAPEIFAGRKLLTLEQDVVNQVATKLARNVAMVELVITRSTESFNTTTGIHRVYLHNVPKTLSYGGKLLRSTGGGAYEVSTTQPDMLQVPLKGNFVLQPHSIDPGFLQSDAVRFIIPAHMGDDFWSIDGNGVAQVNPHAADTLKTKMMLTLDLERPGNGRFTRTVEIPTVAHANSILKVNITVSADITVSTDILPWNYVGIDQGAGAPESRWVYVKKGSRGTGLSWSDAVGTIADGITAIQKLKAQFYDVLGVIVAGGPTRLYNESIDVNTGAGNIRIYGGYEGTPGTELVGGTTPSFDSNRKLGTHKAIITGDNYIKINDKVIRLDGFSITDKDVIRTKSPLLIQDGADIESRRLVNAVEILSNKAQPDISMIKAENNTQEVMMTNMLIAENEMLLELDNPKVTLANATIVKNGKIAITNTTKLINTVFWQNASDSFFGNTCILENMTTIKAWELTPENEGPTFRSPYFDLAASDITNRYKFTSLKSALYLNALSNNEYWMNNANTGIAQKYEVYEDAYGNHRLGSEGKMDVGAFGYGALGSVLTIYAKWTATTWDIIYYDPHPAGSYVRFPAPPVHPDPNYEFRGWFASSIGGSQYPNDGIIMPYRNLDVWALFKPKEHLVTFDGNGATGGAMTPQGFAYGVGKELAANRFVRTDYFFSGWGLVPEGPKVYNDNAMYTPTGNVTLYAQWLPLKVRVTFDGNNADDPSAMVPQEFTTGVTKSLSINKYTRAGFVFMGWSISADGVMQYADRAPFATQTNVTLYAVWAVDNRKIVTFNGNGANQGAMDQQIFQDGERKSLTPNAFARTGFAFVGWRDATTGVAYTDKQAIAPQHSMTLDAQWEEAHTITYDANGGTGVGPATQIVVKGATANIIGKERLQRDGYVFGGWSELKTDAHLSDVIYTSRTVYNFVSGGKAAGTETEITPTRDVTLYAIWVNTPAHYLTVAADGTLAVAEAGVGKRALLFKWGSAIGLDPGSKTRYNSNQVRYDPRIDSHKTPLTNWMDIPFNIDGAYLRQNADKVRQSGLGDPCKLAGLTKEQIANGIVDNGKWEAWDGHRKTYVPVSGALKNEDGYVEIMDKSFGLDRFKYIPASSFYKTISWNGGFDGLVEGSIPSYWMIQVSDQEIDGYKQQYTMDDHVDTGRRFYNVTLENDAEAWNMNRTSARAIRCRRKP